MDREENVTQELWGRIQRSGWELSLLYNMENWLELMGIVPFLTLLTLVLFTKHWFLSFYSPLKYLWKWEECYKFNLSYIFWIEPNYIAELKLQTLDWLNSQCTYGIHFHFLVSVLLLIAFIWYGFHGALFLFYLHCLETVLSFPSKVRRS